MQNRLIRARIQPRSTSIVVRIGASVLIAASLTGCGASGGGVSVGNYTGSGTTTMILRGQVFDVNNAPLVGYTVSIDNSTPVQTGTAGNFIVTIPTIQIVPQNTIRVFDKKNLLAHVEDRPIDTAICDQRLTPIVVGPPRPPGP